MTSSEKLAKNVKQGIEVTCIDSKEPVATILEHFKDKLTPAYYEYCKLLGQRESQSSSYQHNMRPGHPLNTFPEDWDGILPSNYFEPFPYRSTYPKILTPLQNENRADPVTELMERKNSWLIMLSHRLKGLHESGAHLKVKTLNSDVMSCPNNVVQAAIEAENDPEPHFNSAHNWYYTGHGNMHLVALDGDDYMLHSELNHLYLSKFTFDQLTIDPQPVFSYDCGVGENIFETIFNTNLIVALRTKTRVILLKIVTDKDTSDELTIVKVKEISARIPYTSIAFDPIHKDILYVTNLDNKLSIVNMEKMKARTVKLTETDTLIDNWSSVFGVDRNMYGHISSDNIHLYDKRDNSVIHTWSEPAKISDGLCNKFSVATLCDNRPFLYIGSTHHLFLADLRYLTNAQIKFVTRWTHQMKCAPTYLTTCNFEFNKDLVYLSSQWYEDMCVVSNDSDSIEKGVLGTNITMPFRPPTVEHTLNDARLKMLCLDIYHPIENRLYTSTTGTTVLEKDEKVYIFNQNSLGDKFCHILYPEHIEMWDDDGPERLDKWYRSVKPIAQVLEISKIEDISHVWRDLKKVPSDMTFGCRRLWPEDGLKYSEQEVVETFENDLDVGLLEAWGDKPDQVAASENYSVHLHFSDDSD